MSVECFWWKRKARVTHKKLLCEFFFFLKQAKCRDICFLRILNYYRLWKIEKSIVFINIFWSQNDFIGLTRCLHISCSLDLRWIIIIRTIVYHSTQLRATQPYKDKRHICYLSRYCADEGTGIFYFQITILPYNDEITTKGTL